MFKAAFFIITICLLILLGWSDQSTLLFGTEYGKKMRTAPHFAIENLPVYYEVTAADSQFIEESTAANLSYLTFSPKNTSSISPTVYYPVYDDTGPPLDEDFYQQPPEMMPYWENNYDYFEPEPESPCFSDYFSIDDNAADGYSDNADDGYSDNKERFTYKTFPPKVHPLVKEAQLAWYDVQNLYSCKNAGNYAVMLGLMAIVANTPADQKVADWYQNEVRSSATDDVSSVCKVFGEGNYIYPIFISGALIGDALASTLDDDSRRNQSPVGEYFSRTARAEVIAVPVLLLGQAALGAARPCNGEWASYWSHPFTSGYNSGISGHAYVGSIPFITLAQMSESYWSKTIFYAASTLTGISRINDNAHYLSQVILGWYLGYLSCRSVTETETGPLDRGLTLFPLVTEESTQIGFSYSY